MCGRESIVYKVTVVGQKELKKKTVRVKSWVAKETQQRPYPTVVWQ